VKIFKGFVIDRMKSEDFLLLDDNVDEFDEYVDADALGHKVWMTVGDAKRQFRMERSTAPRATARPRADAGDRKTDDTPPTSNTSASSRSGTRRTASFARPPRA
jgi:hypothetical protein